MHERSGQQAALLEEIKQFLREAGIAESTFGFRAVNDGKFVSRLRQKKRMWPETMDRVREYMRRERQRLPSKPGRAA